MTDSVNIIPINIEEEIRQSYMDYAMSVIIGRALPDVRDGLKPVHRRILFAQRELGNRYNTAYKKSARSSPNRYQDCIAPKSRWEVEVMRREAVVGVTRIVDPRAPKRRSAGATTRAVGVGG